MSLGITQGGDRPEAAGDSWPLPEALTAAQTSSLGCHQTAPEVSVTRCLDFRAILIHAWLLLICGAAAYRQWLQVSMLCQREHI